MTFLVMAFGVVHHWDGSFDGVAALSASKEHVPANGTRFAQDVRPSLMTTVLSTMTT